MKPALFPLMRIGILAFAYLYATSEITNAQVTPDGTVNTQVNQTDNVSEITGGETRGNNLFHSFQEFSVRTGNEAFFNNANNISNIFSRVTGGNASTIDGLIRANGSASLFLINPAGIIFGEGARLDIGGSFYGSSADSILFEDGEFSATDLDNPPVLTINAPIGLNLRDEPGDIVNRSIVQNSNEEFVGLAVAPGNNLAFIGGNINFEAGEATASGGNIELGGLSEAGIVSINEDGSLSFPEDVTKADITLSNAADVDARGIGGGSVTVNARNLTLTPGEFGGSLIRAGIRPESTFAEAQAGDITIDVADKITLDDSGILNQVNSGGAGNSGKIIINTGSLTANNGGQVDATTFGQGDAGAVNITATGDLTFDGEDSEGFPSGATSLVDTGAVGNAGGVTISTNNLTLTNGGRVAASTLGKGDAGEVNITATGDLTFDGEDSGGFPSGATSGVDTDAKGNAGGVTISTNNLTLTNGAIVDASTFGQGNAGLVDITATGDLTFDGEDSGGSSSGATSGVDTDAKGNAGGVTISTNNLTLTNGGRVGALTLGQGDAGSVDITATGDLTFDGEDSGGFPSGATSGVAPGAVGNAGGVTISTNNLTLTNGGWVDASTLGQGNAGLVNITATGDLTFDGENSEGFPSGATSLVDTGAVGNAGGVTIFTNNLNLTNGGYVDASTLGKGDAGSVDITAIGDITIDGETLAGFPGGATSLVNPGAEGNAGGVTISTTNLNLTNGGSVDASTFGQGNAGIVTIDASESIFISGAIERFRSGISANALNGNGNGGDVNVTTNQLTIANGGTIEASNLDNIGGEDTPGTGQPGNIFIKANNIDLVDTARIDAATQSETGESGKIDLQVAEDITLQENSFISAQAFKNADGGNLNIDARFIIAYPGNGVGNDLVATADAGKGGNIDLNVQQLFGLQSGNAIYRNNKFIPNNTNDLDASSNIDGLGGNITINTSDINPVQGATELPTNVVELGETRQQACEANRDGTAKNGLTIKDKGGVPPAPDLPLNSQSISINGEIDPTISAIPEPIETSIGKIQPARGIKVTKDGRVILTAYRTNNAGERIPEIKPNCNSGVSMSN